MASRISYLFVFTGLQNIHSSTNTIFVCLSYKYLPPSPSTSSSLLLPSLLPSQSISLIFIFHLLPIYNHYIPKQFNIGSRSSGLCLFLADLFHRRITHAQNFLIFYRNYPLYNKVHPTCTCLPTLTEYWWWAKGYFEGSAQQHSPTLFLPQYLTTPSILTHPSVRPYCLLYIIPKIPSIDLAKRGMGRDMVLPKHTRLCSVPRHGSRFCFPLSSLQIYIGMRANA